MLDRARKYLSIILQIFVRDLKRLVVNHLGGRLHPARALRLVHHRNDVGSLHQHRLDQSGGGK